MEYLKLYMKKTDKNSSSVTERYKAGRREDLIPILQEIQEETGYLTVEAIVKVSKLTGLSTTKIYGLATFYDQFRFMPPGKIHLKICNGTSCYMNGSGALINKIREELGIEPGETTRDGRFSYEITGCMGGCANGPLILINEDYHVKIRHDQIPAFLSALKKKSELM